MKVDERGRIYLTIGDRDGACVATLLRDGDELMARLPTNQLGLNTDGSAILLRLDEDKVIDGRSPQSDPPVYRYSEVIKPNR